MSTMIEFAPWILEAVFFASLATGVFAWWLAGPSDR